jgi:hypothetical protein
VFPLSGFTVPAAHPPAVEYHAVIHAPIDGAISLGGLVGRLRNAPQSGGCQRLMEGAA